MALRVTVWTEIVAAMSLRTVILLIYCLLGTSLAMECREVPGRLKQIDAGVGQVFGVNENDRIYTLYGGNLDPATWGPKACYRGALWGLGVNRNNKIYKLVGADWALVGGLLKQVDAGGDQFVAGVNMNDNVYCLGRDPTIRYRGPGSPAPWNMLPGRLMYYSCGPNGCWGVNSAQNIYVRKGVTPAACKGNTDWQLISGKLVMIEVGTDGSVYGVNAGGDVYRRDGITAANPAGTAWTFLSMCGKCKHVSYDLGRLWLITKDDRIMECTV